MRTDYDFVVASTLDREFEKLAARVAQNIKRIRNDRRWTQAEMERHGFGLRNYQKIEAGKANLTMHTLLRLARAFKVEIPEFFQ